MGTATRTVLTLLLAVGVLYAAVLAWLWHAQEQLLFFPEPLPAGYRLANETDVHEVTVRVPGAELSVLHLQRPGARGMVFFLHGNAGNLAGWFSNTEFYRQAGYDLVMMDYRGYGKSTGRIESAEQLRADVRAVWNQFAPLYAAPDQRVVVLGRSLGSALAADLAAQLTAEGRPPALTVLVSAYTSLRDLMREVYPWVPTALLRYPLDTASHLPQVGGPVLLLHGERDELIAPAHSKALQGIAPKARLVVVPGAGHNDIHMFEGYRGVLRGALRGE